MIMYLLAYDWVRPGLWAATAPGRDRARLVSGPQERPDWFFSRVRSAVDHPRSIWLMRIVAHGNRAGFKIADGRAFPNWAAWVNLQNLDQTFGQLAGCFTPGGPGIELHCCNVASADWETYGPGQSSDHSGRYEANSAGMRFVQNIADITSARVTAAVSDQEVAINRPDDWQFERTYVVVNPSSSSMRERQVVVHRP